MITGRTRRGILSGALCTEPRQVRERTCDQLPVGQPQTNWMTQRLKEVRLPGQLCTPAVVLGIEPGEVGVSMFGGGGGAPIEAPKSGGAGSPKGLNWQDH